METEQAPLSAWKSVLCWVLGGSWALTSIDNAIRNVINNQRKINQKSTKNQSKIHQKSIRNPQKTILEAIRAFWSENVDFKRVPRRFGRCLGCVLGRPGGVLGGFRTSLGASWGALGRLGGVLGLIF